MHRTATFALLLASAVATSLAAYEGPLSCKCRGTDELGRLRYNRACCQKQLNYKIMECCTSAREGGPCDGSHGMCAAACCGPEREREMVVHALNSVGVQETILGPEAALQTANNLERACRAHGPLYALLCEAHQLIGSQIEKFNQAHVMANDMQHSAPVSLWNMECLCTQPNKFGCCPVQPRGALLHLVMRSCYNLCSGCDMDGCGMAMRERIVAAAIREVSDDNGGTSLNTLHRCQFGYETVCTYQMQQKIKAAFNRVRRMALGGRMLELAADEPLAVSDAPQEPEGTAAPEVHPDEPEPTSLPEVPVDTDAPEGPEPTQAPELPDPEPSQAPELPQPTQAPEAPEATHIPEGPQPTQAPESPQPTEPAPKAPEQTNAPAVPKDPTPTEAPEPAAQPATEASVPQPAEKPVEPEEETATRAKRLAKYL